MGKRQFCYSGENLREISFPVGGIGTGSVGIAGNGLLVDWEIFNRPNKRSYNGYTHFALKAEAEGVVADSRMLMGDFQGSRMGSFLRGGKLHSGYGFGPERMTLAGMPHFKETEFEGEYPFAKVRLMDENMPAKVEIMSFNPFIPSDEDRSGIPAAFFEISIENTGNKIYEYTLSFALTNPIQCEKSVNKIEIQDNLKAIFMKPYGLDEKMPEYGDFTIATDGEDISYQQYWYRGNRSDSLEMFWKEFTCPGRLKDRYYDENYQMYKGQGRNKDTAVLAVHFSLVPGEKKDIRYVLSWNVPNIYNYWNPEPEGQRTIWKNYYTRLFRDSQKSAEYCIVHWDELYQLTEKFHQRLMESSLPNEAREAILANISILKTPTCLRLENGEFYGFEGCIEDEGCCEGSCTHVWNYAYALPFLFPKLERSMRDLEYRYNQDETGKMSFRLQLPLGRSRDGFNACVDGQMGGIYKVYREWRISGDDEWLRRIWPEVKKALEYAWNPQNNDCWDPSRTGVITGRQHHTLDMELFGANSWLTGMYLLALKSAEIMAAHLGYTEEAQLYAEVFEKGKKRANEKLFNGEYFVQDIELDNREILKPYCEQKALFGESVLEAYWNEENGQIKYQVGEGCLIDQVLAQWHANLSGLGEIFERKKVQSALKSVYKYNFYSNMRQLTNTWRIYSLDDEAGTVICSWPSEKGKPDIPIAYNSETMTGFEYQVGIHMIQEGMEQEGMELVSAVRGRYNGKNRNPWNEIECGSNYARSMASYALLLTYSGFQYDMPNKRIGFSPVEGRKRGRFFWSLDGAWGSVEFLDGRVQLTVDFGSVHLVFLGVGSFFEDKEKTKAQINGQETEISYTGGEFRLGSRGVHLRAGDTLMLTNR